MWDAHQTAHNNNDRGPASKATQKDCPIWNKTAIWNPSRVVSTRPPIHLARPGTSIGQGAPCTPDAYHPPAGRQRYCTSEAVVRSGAGFGVVALQLLTHVAIAF